MVLTLRFELEGNDATTLDCLAVGQAAIVQDVRADEPHATRLRAMGLCAGRGVHLIRGGSRPIVCVAGTRLGLDVALARLVVVQPLDVIGSRS